MKSVLPRYRSHKSVHAAEILEIVTAPELAGAFLVLNGGHEVEVGAAYLGRHQPRVGGYYVLYPDGDEAWSHAQAFEESYSLLDELGDSDGGGADEAPGPVAEGAA